MHHQASIPLDQLPFACLLLDQHAVIQALNPLAQEFCGTAAQPGQPAKALFEQLGWDGFTAAFAHALTGEATAMQAGLAGRGVIRFQLAPAGSSIALYISAYQDNSHQQTDQETRRLLTEGSAILDSVSFGICLIRNQTIDSANAAFDRLFGYPAGGSLGLHISAFFVDPAEAEALRQTVIATHQQGQTFQTEIPLRRQDGSVFWCAVSSRALDADDPTSASIWTAQDIHEKKHAELAMQESAALYDQLFNKHPAIKMLLDPESGAIVLANPAAAQFYGYPLETLLQMNINQINPLPAEETIQQRQAVLHHRQNTFHVAHRLASGELRQVEVNAAPVEYNGRTVLFSIIHDITERLQAETALKQERDFAQTVMNTMGQGLTVTDEDLNFIYVNPAYAQMVGENPADIVGRSTLEFLAAGSEATMRQARLERKAGRATTYTVNLRRADGQNIPVTITGVPILEDRRVTGSISVITDLTRQKRLEMRLKYITENATDYIIELNRTGDMIFINRALHPMTQQEVIGQRFNRNALPAYQQPMLEHLERTFRTGQPQELDIQRHEGSGDVHWYRLRFHLMPYDGPLSSELLARPDLDPRTVIVFATAITAQKIAQTGLAD